MDINVLLIDDNLDQLTITRKALSNNCQSYLVDSAVTAKEGIKKIRDGHYDIVLCDYRLPDVTGIDVLNQLKKGGFVQPFIIITSAGSERVAVEAMKLGASDYIVKDSSYEDILVEVIRKSWERYHEKKERERLEIEGKRAEEALRAAYHRLEDTQSQLIQAEKLGVIGLLASGIAHEVKNPLTIISHGIHQLKKELKPQQEQAIEVLQMMEEAVDRADGIVHGLLDFSRPSKVILQPHGLQEVIESALRLVQKQLLVKNIQVKKDIAPDLCPVLLDESQMKQVFINLLLNAFQSMPDGGELCIECLIHTLDESEPPLVRRKTDMFKTGDKVLVCFIKDTGAGIPAEMLSKVFDPFFTTKPSGQGTGLGLAITQHIIESHRGQISIDSEAGKGTMVTILLPVFVANAG